MLSEKLPEVLDFSKDLASLEPASKVSLFQFPEKVEAFWSIWLADIDRLDIICPDTTEIFG